MKNDQLFKNYIKQYMSRKRNETFNSKSSVVNILFHDLSFCSFQMCELLHYFCDCELKHRIEAIAAFADNFVSKLQFNQKYRYNELMQALNMSAAVTAKKTKEFRSPPQEQVLYHTADVRQAAGEELFTSCF